MTTTIRRAIVKILFSLLLNMREVVLRIYEPPFKKQRTSKFLRPFLKWYPIITEPFYIMVDFLRAIFALLRSGILPPT